MTRGLITGDFDLYRRAFALPVLNEPRDGRPYVLHSEEDLEADFRLYCTAVAIQQVTDIYRDVKAIHALGDGTVMVEVETNILRHATRIVDPFPTEFHWVRGDDGDWRISRITSSEGHINWTIGRAQISERQEFVELDRNNKAPDGRDGDEND